VKGPFRTLKWWIMAATLGVYYLTPWLRWERRPNLPDQAVLVDLGNRRFFFFMIEIWPHEFYFVAGLLIMAGLGLFLFTSAAGRVWCGYACPQTFWTDLFILVERWVEGDRNARIRLHRQHRDAEKLRKRVVKFTLWFLIALATGGGVDLILHGCAHTGAGSGGGNGASGCLYLNADPDCDDLCLWRVRAGTDLHLRLSMATYSGGDDG
jgi:cytochrome c oxidase accessory protein FixG